MTKKRVLGKGLNALIPTSSPSETDTSLWELEEDRADAQHAEKTPGGVHLVPVDAIAYLSTGSRQSQTVRGGPDNQLGRTDQLLLGNQIPCTAIGIVA